MGIWKGDRVMGMGSLLLGIPLTHSGYPQYYTILNVLISGMDGINILYLVTPNGVQEWELF
jgi:hypothetical protein